MKQVMKDCDVCNKAQAWPLRGCEPPGLPPYSMYECTKCYKYLKKTIEHFWNRFSQEYMRFIIIDDVWLLRAMSNHPDNRKNVLYKNW